MKNGQKSSEVRVPQKGELRPKRYQNPQSIFFTQQLPVLMKENKVLPHEAMKMGSVEWKNMTEDQRKPFFEKSMAQKKVYDNPVQEFKEKGYFTLPNGEKSYTVQ